MQLERIIVSKYPANGRRKVPRGASLRRVFRQFFSCEVHKRDVVRVRPKNDFRDLTRTEE